MKVYLDNNIVSAIPKDDTPAESDPIDRLLEAQEAGKVELVTSRVTLEEINRYHGPSRTPVERTYRLIEKVRVIPWNEIVGMHSYGDSLTWITSPMIQEDPLYTALSKIGLQGADLQHVFVASKHACAVLLTCDRPMRSRAAGIQALCGLVVQRPSEFVSSQGW